MTPVSRLSIGLDGRRGRQETAGPLSSLAYPWRDHPPENCFVTATPQLLLFPNFQDLDQGAHLMDAHEVPA
jgi:hypothetical protein